MKNKIILVAGDPISINSEIIYKTWKKLSLQQRKNTFVIANFNLLKDQFNKLNYKIKIIEVENIQNSINTKKLKIINVDIRYKNPFDISKKTSSKYIIDSLTLAHQLALDKNVAGIINCPINKNLLSKKGIGVTEFLASKCSVKNNLEVMLIKSKKLMVSPMTTHLDLKLVSKKITKKLIINKTKVIFYWFKKFYGRKPKIAMLGLNPHNAEYRKDSEEKKIIIPAINNLKKIGLKLSGPLSSDTVFINNYKNYDIIIGMYHDQVLTPLKTLYKFDAINITLGLKYNRVSPDHGVAADKILKKVSDPKSLLRCFDFVTKSVK